MKKITLILWLLLSILAIKAAVRLQTPWANRSQWYTDHRSHLAESLVFWFRGLAVYQPLVHVCNQPEDLAVHIPQISNHKFYELCYLRERPYQPPMYINWQEWPKPYPLGLFLLMLPLALLWQYDIISPLTAAHGVVIECMLFAMFTSLMLRRVFFEQVTQKSTSKKLHFFHNLILMMLWLWLSSELILWGLDGVYDIVACAAVLYAFGAYHRQQYLLSLWGYSLSLCLHFRMLYYAPLPIFALQQWWQQCAIEKRPLWQLSFGEKMIAMSTIVFGLGFLIPFLKTWSTMASFPDTNFLHGAQFGNIQLGFWSCTAVAVTVLLSCRFFLAASCITCIAILLQTTTQTQSWHILALIGALATVPPGLRQLLGLTPVIIFTYTASRLLYYNLPHYWMGRLGFMYLLDAFYSFFL